MLTRRAVLGSLVAAPVALVLGAEPASASIRNFRQVPGLSGVYRSATLSSLSKRDRAKLEALGLAVIVDLAHKSDPKLPGVTVVEARLYEDYHPNHAAGYRRFVTQARNRKGFRLAFAGIAAAGPGPILVHCKAGKNRTGCVVALLMLLAGASTADVYAEYLRSSGTHRSYLDAFLGAVSDYGGPEEFLTGRCGVTPAQLAAVRARI